MSEGIILLIFVGITVSAILFINKISEKLPNPKEDENYNNDNEEQKKISELKETHKLIFEKLGLDFEEQIEILKKNNINYDDFIKESVEKQDEIVKAIKSKKSEYKLKKMIFSVLTLGLKSKGERRFCFIIGIISFFISINESTYGVDNEDIIRSLFFYCVPFLIIRVIHWIINGFKDDLSNHR